MFWNVLNGGGFRERTARLGYLQLPLLLTIYKDKEPKTLATSYLLTKRASARSTWGPALPRLLDHAGRAARAAYGGGGGINPPRRGNAPAGESCERAGGGGCDETGGQQNLTSCHAGAWLLATPSALSPLATLSQSANLTRVDLTVGRTVIPMLARSGEYVEFLAARAELFAAGLYPGVDYIIEESMSRRRDDDLITLRPAYPLVKKLERDDHVSVPLIWLRGRPGSSYALHCCISLRLLRQSWLVFGFTLSQFLTLSKSSASMT